MITCRRRHQRDLLPVAAALACLALSTPALGQAPEDKAAAQSRMKDGAALLDSQPGEALRLFREAYRLVRNPNYQYNIGIAAQAVGRDAEALEAFRFFLANRRGVPDEYVSDAEKQVQALLGRVALVTLSSSQPDAEVLVDGRDVGRTPLVAPLALDQGDHRFIVRKRDFENFERLVTVHPGEKVAVAADLRPLVVAPPLVPVPVAAVAVTPPPAPTVSDQAPIHKRWWFWTAVGAVVVTGVVIGIAASSHSGGPDCPGGPICVRNP
jgi:hypothetical protein